MKKFLLSIVFVVGLASSAFAQTADQHFKAGLEFYNTKAYDQAITSFSAAKPRRRHARVHYDAAIADYSQGIKLAPSRYRSIPSTEKQQAMMKGKGEL